MPKRTNFYQQVVRRAYEELATAQMTVTESALLAPIAGGEKREIDVLVEAEVAGHPVRIAVEVRAHANIQDITWIDSIVGKYAGLAVDKLVAVSIEGFSAAARKKAASHHIDLVELVELPDIELPDVLKRLAVAFVTRNDVIVGVTVVVESGSTLALRNTDRLQFESDSTPFTAADAAQRIYDAAGAEEIGRLVDLSGAKTVAELKKDRAFTLRMTPPEQLFLLPEGGDAVTVGVLNVHVASRFAVSDVPRAHFHLGSGVVVSIAEFDPDQDRSGAKVAMVHAVGKSTVGVVIGGPGGAPGPDRPSL